MIARLELLARGAMEGTVTGRHRSPNKGFSVEFAEHRPYVPGDDLRDLDWRVYGKNDRYFIKQYVEETNLRATLLVDASGSMAYTGERAAEFGGRRLSKLDYARYLAAALTYLLVRQQDAVGLVTFDAEVRAHLRAAGRPSQVRLVLEELLRTTPGASTRAAATFHDIAERIHARGLVLVFSDLFDDPAAMVEALHHFKYRRHEVVLFHLMADEEISFPFQKFNQFRDLEAPGRQVQVDPRAVRARYLERVREFIRTIEEGCGQMGADYVPVNTRQPFVQTLADYLSQRRGKR